MNTVSDDRSGAIVGWGDDLAWFDTMPGEQMALRVNSGDVGGAFTVIEAHVPAYAGPPMHYHEEREEIFEVLEGWFRFHCAGEEFEARPGTSVVIPRKNVHGWVNLGAASARLLFTFVPGGIDEFFPLIGQTPPPRWHELGQRHDTWIVGEPMVVDNPGRSASEEKAAR